MKIVVDVQFSKKAVEALQDAGHEVIQAQEAEWDREWVQRALDWGVQAISSPDWDIRILCYDLGIKFYQLPCYVGGLDAAKRFLSFLGQVDKAKHSK